MQVCFFCTADLIQDSNYRNRKRSLIAHLEQTLLLKIVLSFYFLKSLRICVTQKLIFETVFYGAVKYEMRKSIHTLLCVTHRKK